MNESFDARWLAERAAADECARALARIPLAAAQHWADARPTPLVCCDLGCGLGANAAWLAPRLPGPQRWQLVDHDPALLACAGERELADDAGTPAETRTMRADLAAGWPADLESAHLVTGAALLDLVSAAWLDALVATCSRSGAAALFALSYDGHFHSEAPGDPDEPFVRAAFNRDQRRDKGFGPALGPAAALYAARAFRAAGYAIHLGRSPWQVGPEQPALQRRLVDGQAEAARRADPLRARAIDEWNRRRHRAIDAGDGRLWVGHLDLFAQPAARA